MDAEVKAGLRRPALPKRRAEEQLGLTELTVNSCFLCFRAFIFLSCVPPHLSFLLFSLKSSWKGVAFQIFYIPLHSDTHSAHAELMLSFSKREIVDTRTWEGSGIMT